MDMIAKKHFRYGGALRAPGDSVTLKPRDVRLFRALGRIDVAPVVAAQENAADEKAEDAEKNAEAVVERSTYSTRDMIAAAPSEPVKTVAAVRRGRLPKGARE